MTDINKYEVSAVAESDPNVNTDLAEELAYKEKPLRDLAHQTAELADQQADEELARFKEKQKNPILENVNSVPEKPTVSLEITNTSIADPVDAKPDQDTLSEEKQREVDKRNEKEKQGEIDNHIEQVKSAIKKLFTLIQNEPDKIIIEEMAAKLIEREIDDRSLNLISSKSFIAGWVQGLIDTFFGTRRADKAIKLWEDSGLKDCYPQLTVSFAREGSIKPPEDIRYSDNLSDKYIPDARRKAMIQKIFAENHDVWKDANPNLVMRVIKPRVFIQQDKKDKKSQLGNSVVKCGEQPY